MLVHIKKIIDGAVKGNYAVGAFNVNNLEIILAVLRAAEELCSPAIIQMTEGAIKYAGLKELSALARAAAAEANVPIALHLDHGHSFELIKQCIDEGFSSVMIDGSLYGYSDNVKQTKAVVKYAHQRQVFVQGEIGRLEGLEDWVKVGGKQSFLTEPETASQFLTDTKVDTLAVAIGNYHGVEKILENKYLKLDLPRLKKIADMIDVPLVLHGASGFSEKEIRGAIKFGIRVINIDSDLRIAFTNAEKEFLAKNKKVYDPRKIMAPAIEAMSATVAEKIKIFGSKNKGKL